MTRFGLMWVMLLALSSQANANVNLSNIRGMSLYTRKD